MNILCSFLPCGFNRKLNECFFMKKYSDFCNLNLVPFLLGILNKKVIFWCGYSILFFLSLRYFNPCVTNKILYPQLSNQYIEHRIDGWSDLLIQFFLRVIRITSLIQHFWTILEKSNTLIGLCQALKILISAYPSFQLVSINTQTKIFLFSGNKEKIILAIQVRRPKIKSAINRWIRPQNWKRVVLHYRKPLKASQSRPFWTLQRAITNIDINFNLETIDFFLWNEYLILGNKISNFYLWTFGFSPLEKMSGIILLIYWKIKRHFQIYLILIYWFFIRLFFFVMY